MLREGERLEKLGGGISAIVSAKHTFGADAVLLASFSLPRPETCLCDLGTGCGIIPLLWCAKGGPYQIDAFELMADAADIAARSAALNGLPIKVHHADLRMMDPSFYGKFDLVACNPPYGRAGGSIPGGDRARAAARHETACTLEEVAGCAAKLLKNGGSFCLCHRPERLPDVFEALRACRMEPKRLRLAQHNRTAKPWLALIEARKGARPGGLVVLPVLLSEENGCVSQEMRQIYGNYED